MKMSTRIMDNAAEPLKSSAEWSAEAFGEGGYEVVPPEKEEEFRKMAEEDGRRRRPGMYADDDVAIRRLAHATLRRRSRYLMSRKSSEFDCLIILFLAVNHLCLFEVLQCCLLLGNVTYL